MNHESRQKGLTGGLCGLLRPPGIFMVMEASLSRTLTDAPRPSTSLTAHSVRRTALVTAAQIISLPHRRSHCGPAR